MDCASSIAAFRSVHARKEQDELERHPLLEKSIEGEFFVYSKISRTGLLASTTSRSLIIVSTETGPFNADTDVIYSAQMGFYFFDRSSSGHSRVHMGQSGSFYPLLACTLAFSNMHDNLRGTPWRR